MTTTRDVSDWLSGLRSRQHEIVLNTLYKIGGAKVSSVDELIADELIMLMNHPEADIRERAIFAGALHFRLKQSVPKLSEMVLGEEKDETVLSTVIDAVGSLAVNQVINICQASSILGRLVLNDQLSHMLHANAYKHLLRLHERISVREFAAFDETADLKIDLNWVRKLVAPT